MKEDIQFEKEARRTAMREQIKKQNQFFNLLDPQHAMEYDLHSFLSSHDTVPIQRDENGFIDFEKAYNE
jgi:hypothetical protein